MVCGVYKITNTTNGNFYIGSSLDIKSRWRCHRHDYVKPRSSSKLYGAMRKYGVEHFSFEIMEVLPKEKEPLIAREQFYIDTLEPHYNIRKKADSNMGIKLSAETCERIRLSKIGSTPWNKGRPADPVAIAKMIATKRANPMSAERRKEIGDWRRGVPPTNKGVSHSPEARAKMSASRLGKPSPKKGRQVSPETLEKMLNLAASRRGKPSPLKGRPSPLKGRPSGKKGCRSAPHSEETKRKLSERAKNRSPEAYAKAVMTKKEKRQETVNT